MKAPYPYFGGKSTIMSEVWQRLGDTYNFVDPFFGSNAPLLSRTEWNWCSGEWRDGENRVETINDKDCFVANFQRALKHKPEELAHWADDSVNEADLHARHLWLVNNKDFIKTMKTDPDYFDVKVAGWWVWGICQWIGGGWCFYPEKQQRPHLGDAGRGVHRPSQRLPHLGNAGMGVHRPSQQRPHLMRGMGIFRESSRNESLHDYFAVLSRRLRRVRVCCGDWTRVLGTTPTEYLGLTSIILDPPYGEKARRASGLYAQDDLHIANQVRTWAIENGNNPKLRIALFGYEDEHRGVMPGDWECFAWKAHGGFSNQRLKGGAINPHKERIWFSPHCLKVEGRPRQLELSGMFDAIR